MYLTVRLIVALLTFAVGVSAYTARSTLLRPRKLQGQLIPVSELREDRLHRLYEAVLASGRDSETRQRVLEQLVCTNTEGIADAHLTALEGQNKAGCEKRDGTIYVLNWKVGPYGPMFHKIQREHSSWSLKNLDFIKEIGTPEQARKYVRQHIGDVIPEDS